MQDGDVVLRHTPHIHILEHYWCLPRAWGKITPSSNPDFSQVLHVLQGNVSGNCMIQAHLQARQPLGTPFPLGTPLGTKNALKVLAGAYNDPDLTRLMRPGVTYSKAGVYEVDFFTIFHDFLGIVLLVFNSDMQGDLVQCLVVFLFLLIYTYYFTPGPFFSYEKLVVC